MKKEIFINGYIGEADMFGGIQSFSLADLNNAIANFGEDVTELDVHINSGGGLVSEGFAIYDKLVSLPYTVNTIVEGMCGSIATVIAQAGKKGTRRMFQNSEYFVHNPAWIPSAPDAHNADSLERLTADLRKSEEKILNFYVQTTGADKALLADKMNQETTLSAVEAKQLGFIDEIINTEVNAMVRYKIAAVVLPESKQLNNNNPMEKTLKEEFKAGFDRLAGQITALLKGKTVNAMSTTNDGTNIYYDGELAEGTPVFSDEAMTTPLADGSYTLDNGNVIEVASGAVTTITMPAEAKTEAEIANEKIADLEAKLATKEAELVAAKKEREQFVAAATAVKTEFEAFKNKIITGKGEIFETTTTDPKTNIKNAKPGDWRSALVAKKKASNNQ